MKPASSSQETASDDLPQPAVQGLRSSQHARIRDLPSSDRQPTAFTLDPLRLRVHHISTDIDQTAETTGQQGQEELVPEGEYDIRSQELSQTQTI